MVLFSVIGVILIILLLIFALFRSSIRETVTPAKHNYDSPKSPSPQWLINLKNNSKFLPIAFTLASILALSNWLFFNAAQGNQYYLVYPTGGWDTHFTNGVKLRLFATVQEWQKEIDVKVVADGDPTDGVEGVIRDKTTFIVEDKSGKRVDNVVPGISITFIDRVQGAVVISTRLTMPKDPESFRNLAESFKSQDNLINNTVIPTIREQVSNTGYQYAAQDYISGAATDFRQAIDDQLKYGGYSTERKEYNDTIYASIQEKGPRSIKEINTRYKIIRNVDANGKLIRIPHEISKNKIFVSQVIVDKVSPEPTFQRRLEAQRDISAQKRIEMEKIETAKAEQQRIIAEGERDKAKERVEQEKEQVKALIAIETELKQETTRKQLAEIALQTERINSEANLVKERAQAEANRLKVAAGLTPQERAEFENKRAIGVAEHMSKINLPETVIITNGDSKSGGNDLLSVILSAEFAKQLNPSKKDGN